MTMPTDADFARAEALGRAAARAGQPVDSCPYPPDARVLRMRWVLAFTRAGGGQDVLDTGAEAAS